MPHDAKVREWGSGKTRIESMVEHGLKPRLVPNASKADGIQASRRTIQVSLFSEEAGKVLVPALEQYRREWDDDRKTFKANEYRDWTTHPADAFRYMSLAWRIDAEAPPPKPKPQPTGTVVLDLPDDLIDDNHRINL